MLAENKHHINIFISTIIIVTIIYFLYRYNDLRLILLSLPFFASVTFSSARVEIIKVNNITKELKFIIYVEKILLAICLLILLTAQNSDRFGNIIYDNYISFLVVFSIIVISITHKKSKEKAKLMRLK